jgi:hypothetical protein
VSIATFLVLGVILFGIHPVATGVGEGVRGGQERIGRWQAGNWRRVSGFPPEYYE